MLFTVQLGTTAVLLACQFGHRELLEILIDKYHCAVTDKDKACCGYMAHLHNLKARTTVQVYSRSMHSPVLHTHIICFISYCYVRTLLICVSVPYSPSPFCFLSVCAYIEREGCGVVCSCQWPSARSETPGQQVWLQFQCG